MDELEYDTYHAGWLLASLVPAHNLKGEKLKERLSPENRTLAENYARHCIAEHLAVGSGRNNPYKESKYAPELVDGEPIRYDLAPNLADGLCRYIESGVPTGSFLRAVLENDLREACWRADATNRLLLWEFVCWLHNHAPRDCWGSREKVDAWLSRWTAAGNRVEAEPDRTAEAEFHRNN